MTDVIKTHASNLPAARNIRWNPSPAELRELTSRMPNARHTEFDNYNVQTKVVSRSKASTYVVTDRPEEHSDQTITRADGRKIADRQDAHIRDQDMLVIDGYIGNDPEHRVAARLYIEAANANIAGMQRWLYFDPENPGPDFAPGADGHLHTQPRRPGYPNDRVIAVDLDAGVTRVLNSDYFGEFEEGRAAHVEQAHLRQRWPLAARRLQGRADCSRRAGDADHRLVGNGQDDDDVHAPERQQAGAGRLRRALPERPHRGHRERMLREDVRARPERSSPPSTAPSASPRPTSRTSRRTTPVRRLLRHRHTRRTAAPCFAWTRSGGTRMRARSSAVDHFLILNRNDNLIPGVARLNREQAALYFMLGETRGTSAGGKEEAGKFLRVPGTNPFFPLRHEQQGNRFLELMDSSDFAGLSAQHRPGRRQGRRRAQARRSPSRTRARW